MSEIIICLGKNLSAADSKEVMQARVKKAVESFNRYKAEKLILSGGYYGDEVLSEAKFMWVLIGDKISKDKIILEERSIDTLENARFCNKIMDKFGFRSAVVVTSPSHLQRTRYLFKAIMKDKKLDFVKSEDKLSFFQTIYVFIKESFALLLLRLKKSTY
ncbi:MAG: YdcF family protein [Candidatus Woesearchaeota archaeon]